MITPRVCVVGSVNVDLLMTVDPRPVTPGYRLGSRFETLLGGKGLNTALSMAALAPDDVIFLGRVGDDMYGDFVRNRLSGLGYLRSQLVSAPGEHTGIGHVRATPDGEYDTTVLVGANAHCGPSDVASLLDTSDGPLRWVTNMETPLAWWPSVSARGRGDELWVNLSPVTEDAHSVLPHASVVVVNHIEAAALVGVSDRVGGDELALELSTRTPAVTVVTAGAEGAWLAEQGQGLIHSPAHRTEVVSTVGAGDSFFAALAIARGRGCDWHQALHVATTAGSVVAGSADNFLTPHTAGPVKALVDNVV